MTWIKTYWFPIFLILVGSTTALWLKEPLCYIASAVFGWWAGWRIGKIWGDLEDV